MENLQFPEQFQQWANLILVWVGYGRRISVAVLLPATRRLLFPRRRNLTAHTPYSAEETAALVRLRLC
jgi:hypothetical protein